MKKKILIALLAIFIIIQFIRPARNVSAEVPATHIANLYPVPENVQQVLKVSCYDCHSNNTVYPWYTNIQPVGWWLQSHVNEGKEHLDFSAFGSYPPKRQHHKLEEVLEQVQDNHMPLNSYLWMHNDAKLTPEQKTAVMNWAKNLMEQIAKTHNITGESH